MPEPLPRGRNPFDETGVERDADGRARYLGRPDSLVAMLAASVERDPRATAVLEVGGESITYGELWERAARVAGGLREAGVARGDRVAIRLGNGIDWVLAFFGAQMLGAVVVPGQHALHRGRGRLRRRRLGREVHVRARRDAARRRPPSSRAALGHDDLAAIFYTSGTTGFPKGAMTSHGNFLTNSENALRCNPIDRSEGPEISTLVSVPLFHVTGCNSQLIPLLELGGRVEILSGPLDFDGFFTAVGEHGVNQLVSVPAIYHAVMRHPRFAELDVSRVRWISYGGAPIAESLVHRIKEAFPNARVGNGFGLTETSSLTSFLPARGGRRARRLRRLRDAGRRSRDRRAGRGDRGRRAARARAERRAGLLEQARGDRRDVRRRLAAHRRPRARGRRRRCSTSSTARRT